MADTDPESRPEIPPEVLERRDRDTARMVASFEREGLFVMANIAKTAGEIGRYRKVESVPPVKPE